MALDLKILVGTMTGTAEMVADEMCDALEEAGHTVEVLPMDDLEPSVFDDGDTFLIVTSTYGQGDVPDNAMKFYEALCASVFIRWATAPMPKPSISAARNSTRY